MYSYAVSTATINEVLYYMCFMVTFIRQQGREQQLNNGHQAIYQYTNVYQ